MSEKNQMLFDSLYQLICERKQEMPEGSYVTSLFQKGVDQILKKIGEESAEVVIASKNDDRSELIWEIADLWFHTLVLMGWHEITPAEIFQELEKRHQAKSKPV